MNSGQKQGRRAIPELGLNVPAPPKRISTRQTEKDPEIEELDTNFIKGPPPADPNLKVELETLERDGYIILPNLVSEEYIQEVREALRPYQKFTPDGRNNFEGLKTQRIYGLMGKSRVFDHMAAHPRIMAILDQLLLSNFLLTTTQSILIKPGEDPQPLHFDDGFVPVPRPHRPFSYATMWSIDPFTKENGGTVVIPGSHKWGMRRPTEEDMKNAVSICMPPGSVCLFGSQLWHGGGQSLPDAPPRLAIAFQYCEPYIRPQENQFLVVAPEEVPKLSPRIQTLIGYSIHPPFIGHANGLHPLKALPNYIKPKL